MKRYTSIIIIILVIALGLWIFKKSADAPVVTPETNPDIVIHTITPEENEAINFPLVITGETKGTWFFEGSFPVEILNTKQEVIATTFAQGESDWMTTEFVPWTITFAERPEKLEPVSSSPNAYIKFKNDNPSGDPIRDKSFILPIRLR